MALQRSMYCVANGIPTHFANELVLHSKVQSFLLLKDIIHAYPDSYIYPDDRDEFEKHRHDHDLWACKEEMIDRGEGVYVFTKDAPVPEFKSDKVVIQAYIKNPLLYETKKWHFRLVILCVGTRKIYAWPIIHCYISSTPYDVTNLKDTNIHITNRRIQKKAGCEIETVTWDQVVEKLLKDQAPGILEQCYTIVRKSLNALPLTEKDRKGYAMFAYDFLLDDNMRVWLIEINSSPGNMSMSSKLRYPDTPALVEEVSELMIDVRYLGKERTSFRFTVIQEEPEEIF